MAGYVDRSQSHNDDFTINVTVTKEGTAQNKVQYLANSSTFATPPPYESPRKDEISSTSLSKRRSGPRREWNAVAARIAARTANARNDGKRLSSSPSPSRVEKSTSRRPNPGLSIDTSVGRPSGSPRQLFSKDPRRQQGPGYSKLVEDDAKPRKRTEEARAVAMQSQLLQAPSAMQANSLQSKFSPETPTILITPALDGRISAERRARVASSVYSRLTSGATPPTEAGDVPPLPQNLPSLLKKSEHMMDSSAHVNADAKASSLGNKQINVRASNGTTFEEDLDEKRPARVMSSDTLFEEDRYSAHPQLRAIQTRNDYTIDSAITPTPHRSRGWWDLIRTPFDSAKTFSKFGRSPTDGERTPEVPAIPSSIYHNQRSPSDALGLNMLPRHTHNSQALRRLESRDRLQVEPVPPLPNGKRGSTLSTFSPNEREVPFMLQVSPVDNNATTQHVHEKSPLDAKATPESVRSEFSPIGQVVGEGQVVTAKGVVQNPSRNSVQFFQQPTFLSKEKSANTSLRSSLTAEVVKYTSPKPPAEALRPESRWPEPAPYFAPPPTYAHQQGRERSRQASPDMMAAFPPTRFSSFDTRSKEPKDGKLKRLMTRKSKSNGQKSSKKTKRRKWCCMCCCVLLFILVLIGIILGVVLSRQHKSSSSTEATWFNITNYPPIPGGVLTVARPNLRTSVSGCVQPQAMWSCAVPKEQQDSIKPNDPDQPNFEFNIRYDNSSSTSSKLRRSGSTAAHAWKASALQERDDLVLQASPQPPSLDEYSFLGNTTDNIVAPFEGESTPFFISFQVPSSQGSSKKVKRQADNVSAASASTTIAAAASSASVFIPDISTAFPKPDVNPDGTAQAANLLPFPSFQPLRLFNRGRPDEHYGFYTYFERSIFLRSVSFQTSSQEMIEEVPADADGGSEENAATARCSWTDTRFKVQIFTNMGTSAQVIPPDNGTAVPAQGSVSFVRPGSFPYPITITLDRHGGGLTTKMLYCYGMDDHEIQNITNRKFQPEDRAFGGTIVNPSEAFSNVNATAAQGGPGGIDGGTGGCMCEWANWLAN